MKIYVVNMAKDVAKREQIMAQLQNFPQEDVHLFAACEGCKLNEEQLQSMGYYKFHEKYGSFGTLPAFGCSVSHYSLYKKIATDDSAALILEDDALLSPVLREKLPVLHDYICSLGEPAVIFLTPDFFYNKRDLAPIGDGSVAVTKVISGYMTSGYIINREGALLLAQKLFPIIYIADEWKEFARMGLKLYGVVPHLTSYSGELGEIGRSQQQTVGQEPLWARFRHLLGRCKAKIIYSLNTLKGIRRSRRVW